MNHAEQLAEFVGRAMFAALSSDTAEQLEAAQVLAGEHVLECCLCRGLVLTLLRVAVA